jgi:hypothetical protein
MMPEPEDEWICLDEGVEGFDNGRGVTMDWERRYGASLGGSKTT